MERGASSRRRRYQKPYWQRCREYLRNFIAFMFSNVGIIGLVVGYTVAGAFIFIEIEGHTEQELRKGIVAHRNLTLARLWNISYSLNVFHPLLWRRLIEHELLDYQQFIVDAIRGGYDGSEGSEDYKQWSFSSAFLYSLTVITTIGYGNVIPRTQWGKVTTIIYAIIGMPLFLLYLSNIGDVMARSFKWLYAKVCLCRCCPGVARKRAERQRRRTALKDIYYSSSDTLEGDNPDPEISRVSSTQSSDDEDDVTQASYDSQMVTVPLTICLAIMVGYIGGGALLFSKYEDWNFLDGSYFCFISLSTIGFGDIVPGDKIYSDKPFELSFIFCSMYLMLGMALIAMCFNLMQEEVVHKMRSTIRTINYVFRCNR